MDIYTDGSYCPETQLAAIGIVNENKSLGRNIKAINSTEAELIAILNGLVWARHGDTVLNDDKTLCEKLSKRQLIHNHENISLNIIRVMDEKLKRGEHIVLSYIDRNLNIAHKWAYNKTCIKRNRHKNIKK